MPRWGPTCQAQHAARTLASTARARRHSTVAAAGRGRSPATGGRGHGRASGSYPRGMAGRRRESTVAGATSADVRRPRWAAAAWRRTERPESVRVAAAAWRRAATARNGGVEQRRRRPEISAAPPHSNGSPCASMCSGRRRGGQLYCKDSSVPGRGNARDL